LNSKIPYFEVSGNVVAGVFAPTSARYRGYKINGPVDPNPVGIAESENELQVVMYPNPVTDRIQLGVLKSDLSCGLYDMQGKLLRTITLKADKQENSIDVQDLQKGIYSLQFRSETQQIQLKFVKD
jgi:hypothetical protein